MTTKLTEQEYGERLYSLAIENEEQQKKIEDLTLTLERRNNMLDYLIKQNELLVAEIKTATRDGTLKGLEEAIVACEKVDTTVYPRTKEDDYFSTAVALCVHEVEKLHKKYE